jgi:hypothetical protein
MSRNTRLSTDPEHVEHRPARKNTMPFLLVLVMMLIIPSIGTATQNQTLAPANSTLKQTLYVHADGSEKITNFSLVSGTNYTVRLSGTWVWGGCGPDACPGGAPTYMRVADAAYLTEDHFTHFADPSWSNVVYLEINGVGTDLGSFNANHVYTTQIVGNGSQATFKLQDCSFCYGDNAGSLRVEIFEGNASEAFDVGAPVFQQRSQLPPNDPNYAIATWRWGEDFMQGVPEGSEEFLCKTQPFASTEKFCTWGCLVTAWAMLIDRWGHQYDFHTSPRELNKWLCENGGYVRNSANLVLHKPAEYVRKMTGKPFFFFMKNGRDDTNLHNLIYAGSPVILDVGGHYILATGESVSGQNKTWFINDPGGCGRNIFDWPLTTLQERYANSYLRQMWGAELTGGSLASLSIGLASPAELIITDPAGRKTGFDPRTSTEYNENPDAAYFTDQLIADDESGNQTDPIKWFDTAAPINGDYSIQVIGTGSGPYHVYIQMYYADGSPASQVFESQIDTGVKHTYSLHYSDTMLNATFFDVPVAHWAWQHIERLYAAGITGGCGVNPLRYCPDGIVTRAQMAVFLERGIHGPSYTPPSVGDSTGFGDVPTTYWAASFIKQLAADGITVGCGNGNYCPEGPVTRAQMAVFLLRSKYGASYTPPSVGDNTGFGDVPTNYWAAAFIKQLVAEGITVGCGGGNYCPESPVTRDQMAVFLVRTFNLP